MKFEKCLNPSSVPFGVYRIDADYIRAIRKTNELIIDPDENNRYCGPVYHATCERGEFDFFVPVDPEFETAKMFLMTYVEGVLAGVFDFKLMIPCVNKRFLTVDESNSHLVSFCNSCKSDFEACAEDVINRSVE